MLRNIYMALVILLFHFTVTGQTVAVKTLKMQAITINDGLSQGMINCIYQDHFGFMWFGTMDGLNRYDGYHFIVYRHDVFDSASVSGSFITTIFEDSKQRLWIGTALNGLNIFDRETERFIHLDHENGLLNSVSENRILSVQEDKFGAIWVGTAGGLNKIVVLENQEKHKFNNLYATTVKHIYFDTVNRNNELFSLHYETGNTDYFEPSFFIDSKGVIWVGTEHTLFNIIQSAGKNDIVKEVDDNKFASNKYELQYTKNHIHNYVEDTAGNIIYLLRKKYITSFNQATKEVIQFNCGDIDPGIFRSQFIIQSGIIWHATGGRLYQYDLGGNNICNIQLKTYNSEKNLKEFYCVYKDRSGIIWIGTRGYGLLKYNPGAEKFHIVNSGTVIWMSPTKQGDVIAYSGKLMLYQHEHTLPASISFIPVPAFFEKIYRVIPNSTANMAVQNKDGHYWINSAGIFEFNALSDQLKKVSDLHSAIFPFYPDENNELWFGSSDAFCRLDKISGKIVKYPYPLNNVPQFPYNFLQTVLQDTDSSFWLGTVNGLFRFNEKNKSWKQYKNNPKDTASLSADVIFTVCNDPLYPEKYLWLGTNGGGLNRLDKQTGKFIHYNEKDGLPNKVVYGILSDNENNLWMSTNKGLSRFTPSYKANSGGIFKNFEEEDGLQSNEFNRNAFCKTPAGTLFFGGVNGFNYFNPKEIKDNPAIPNVVITDFRINNEPVLFRAGNNAVNNQNTPLSKPVFLSDKIVLPYADNMFSFDFASMDFTAPEKNLYQYKLDGFDKDWIQSANNHSATYTNLDPGTYIFTVKGSNNDGVWNEQGASTTLTILPPWYLTWWFRITVVAIVMALIYLLFRYRLQQKIKLLNVRNRIASDLHDEIGSTLSSVYIYSEVAQKAAADKLPETNTYLKQISADVANMIEALSDIVWTVNAKNDRFENIINRMRAAAIELFEASGYELQLQFDEQLNTLKLGMEDRKNFYLIYKEAINNVAKYAAGKNVSIHLSLDRSTVLLSVKDDGKGFSINREDQGNGLANMKKRTQELQGKLEIISGQGNGTEIKLAFPI